MSQIGSPIDASDPVWADVFADPSELERLDWGRAPLRFKAGEAVSSLVTLERIERWLRYGNLRYPQFSISNAGQAVPPTSYTRTVVFGTHQAPGLPDPERVAARVRSGDTLVFTMPELWDEAAARLCDTLGRVLEAQVRTYAYLTGPSQYGSRPHRDESDIFIVQIAGTKRWELYDVPQGGDWSIGPITHPGEPAEVLDMAPGEAIYLPLGTGHRAQAGPEGSLHLTVAVEVPSLRGAVTTWARTAAETLPRNLRLPVRPDERAAVLADLLGRLAAQASDADAMALLKACTPRREPYDTLQFLPHEPA